MKDDDQTRTRKSPIPRRFPGDSRFGRRETGRESPIPDSAGIGNREIPRFPIRPGPGLGIAVPGPPGMGVPRAARRGFPGLPTRGHTRLDTCG